MKVSQNFQPFLSLVGSFRSETQQSRRRSNSLALRCQGERAVFVFCDSAGFQSKERTRFLPNPSRISVKYDEWVGHSRVRHSHKPDMTISLRIWSQQQVTTLGRGHVFVHISSSCTSEVTGSSRTIYKLHLNQISERNEANTRTEHSMTRGFLFIARDRKWRKGFENKAHKPKKFDVIFHFRFMTSRVAMTKTKWSILYVLRYSDTYFALFPEISESMGKLSGLQGVLRLVSRSYRIPRRFSTKFAHLCTCVGKNHANKTRKINRAFDRKWDK